jgi:hypothetical protein
MRGLRQDAVLAHAQRLALEAAATASQQTLTATVDRRRDPPLIDAIDAPTCHPSLHRRL